ncbi:MAG TPA: HAMP domain-containing sensor histidine kinase [Longimicrobium sp.]|nr:HAMP domain-containing sensor histidine kinase [Longimicrobium sp.]
MANPGRAARNRSAPIIALLLVTLALTGVIAWEAQDAARGHRDAANGALRDYAGFAAFLYRQMGRVSLQRTAGPLLYPFERVVPSSPTAPLPSVQSVVGHAKDDCPTCPRLDSIRSYYRLDLRDGSLQTTGPRLPDADRAWLTDRLRRMGATPPHADAGFEYGIVYTPPGMTPRAFGYLLRRDSAARAVAAYGFEADPRVLVTAAYRPIFGSQNVLPRSLTRGMPHDSLLALTVRDPAGRILYASPRRFGAARTVGIDTMDASLGNLRVEVALRPRSAERLLIGGVPHSRLPHILVMMALSAGLTAVALVQLRRERELQRVRADFVSSVSHELRTPLAQIRMFAETLRLGRVRSDSERTRSIEIIDQEARRLSGLVDNVLLFSRAERRAVRLERRPEQLAALVREAVETFAPLAAARQMTIRETLDDGVVASVDRGAVRQVLLNLLDNAVKYGPAGQTVEVGLSAEGATARIIVRDQGPGIPPRERGRIFAPFVRLKRDAESAVAGSGIGLSVVEQLAALHGGRVRVEDAAGGGARFIVELPAEQGSAAGGRIGAAQSVA